MARERGGEKGAAGPDPAIIKREKEKARQLRGTSWWQALVQKGVCHYCGQTFAAEEITMDHVVPLSRGGRSTKGNIVPACKDCNTKKKQSTPVDMILSGDFNKPLDL